MSLYYEIHVTIEYPGGEHVAKLRTLAKHQGFHMGDLLLMKVEDERSRKDMFFTARADTLQEAVIATVTFTDWLRGLGYNVIRYKIEDTVVDSKIFDSINAIGGNVAVKLPDEVTV